MNENALPPRGMRDILPAEARLRKTVIQQITDVYESFGFRQIETPALELIENLVGDKGGENEKLIYRVLKRGEKLSEAALDPNQLCDLGLRFDLTVPLSRYYANNHAALPRVFKSIQIGPVWRAERPKKGRFRQFVQCDIDVIGAASHIAEIELLVAGTQALQAIGLGEVTVRINDRRILAALSESLGFPEDRFGTFCILLDKLDKIGADGVIQELRSAEFLAEGVDRLAKLFSNPELNINDIRGVIESAIDPAILDGLAHIIDSVRGSVPAGVRVQYDATLVRGMGYYTGPIFEIAYGSYGSSIAGGGRYDNMIGAALGRPAPACGLSIGFERVIEILTEQKEGEDTKSQRLALLVPDSADYASAFGAMREFKQNGFEQVSILNLEKKLSKQLDRLTDEGFSHFAQWSPETPTPEARVLGKK
ncbi:histidine--tRNA ligase [Capsulimonas corticalis]|uniref:Histidine--tRNA ligase n=1 Tax=Capsulimonas corticalis TaxID=2219043 RepID=A0A402D3L1_9BACT|nr:histidine--tRNA ligase [Capsulimonas corticalis]BDI31912.1 histidine--tRNA ligase [Capsulimonas corticalis]